MEVAKTIEAPSWSGIEDLERETKELLDAVRDKSRPSMRRRGAEQRGAAIERTAGHQRLPAPTRNAPAVPSAAAQVLLSKAKSTVEILDDDAPDLSPRELNTREQQSIDADKRRQARFQKIETSYRNLVFESEQARIRGKKDTFVGNDRMTAEDVAKEMNRLKQIEHNSRELSKMQQEETQQVRAFLETDRAVLRVQKAFRGHIGRRKFSLLRYLQNFGTNAEGEQADAATGIEKVEDWIEITDDTTGDVWYYNRLTNKSQWEKPKEMKAKSGKTKTSSNNNNKKKAKNKAQEEHGAINADGMKTLTVSMSLPSLEAMKTAKTANQRATANLRRTGTSTLNNTASFAKTNRMNTADSAMSSENEAMREVEKELGISKLQQPLSLTGPDGYFKPQLRTVVLDALLDTRFDNVSTVLSDTRWFDQNEELIKSPEKQQPQQSAGTGAAATGSFDYVESRLDPSKRPLVSVLTFNKKKQRKEPPIRTLIGEPKDALEEAGIQSAADLTVKNIEHVGFEDPSATQDTMCFGCWSAGVNRRCSLHQAGMKLKPSQTMLLCRNWDLDVMRRRYRSEELQEIFLQRDASLRYNAKRKQFFTVSEQRHPIYRLQSQVLERYNNRMTLFMRIKYWLQSLAESIRQGKVHPSSSEEISRAMRIRRGIANLSKIARYSQANRGELPKAPVTGSSWPERCGLIRYLFQHVDGATGQEVDIIVAEPTPKPVELYKPRHYHVGLTKTIPLPKHYERNMVHENVAAGTDTLPANTFINDLLPGSWVERLSAQVARDSLSIALGQVYSITPVTSVSMQERTKRPMPVTTKFATIGQKPVPGNMAVGGLPLEQLIYQIISTYYPPQYGNFMVMDKASVSPGVSPEISITFASVIMAPTVEGFVERPLEHPLSYRRAPTIALNSNVTSDNKHVYGVNRPEQTGEQAAHGFRTTAWSPMLAIYGEIDPSVFVPGQTVVSLNIPKANISCTTHADVTYPFCEPSTRDNSTLDFYHLLLTGVVSTSKPQVFTALSVQEPGQFQMKYRLDLPMGHLVVAVYRSWAFTQQDTIQEFKTDDGVIYWYHRKTGQTFWERPMHEVEEVSPLLGGTILDPLHNEEPSIICRGEEGGGDRRRFMQGEFRKVMLQHVETKKEALHRRRAAAITVKHARDRGTIPDITGGNVLSIINNAPSTLDVGLSRLDFSKQSISNMPNTDPSGSIAQYIPVLQQNMPSVVMEEQEELMDMYHPQVATPLPLPHIVHGSALDDIHSQQQQSQQYHAHPRQQQQQQQMMMPMMGIPGFDAQALMQMTATLGAVFSTLMSGNQGPGNHNIASNPAQFLQLGMTMGAALLGTGAVDGMVQQQLDNQGPLYGNLASNSQGSGEHPQQHPQPDFQAFGMVQPHQQQQSMPLSQLQEGFFPALSDDQSINLSAQQSVNSRPSRVSQAIGPPGIGGSHNNWTKGEPIGLPMPTAIYSSDKTLDHSEEEQQKLTAAERFIQPLNTMEKARNLQILGEERRGVVTDTPDARPPKVLTEEKASSAEEALQLNKSVPILAYPELTTAVPGGAPPAYQRQLPAGEGVAFVPAEQRYSQMHAGGTKAPPALRRQVMPLPVGFFAAIEAKHVATAAADYLPQVPNLPQSRNIGRVKPRSAAADWLMINFDPWSAGKNPLSWEYVSSLMSKADKLLGIAAGTQATEAMDALRENTVQGAYVSVEDEEGMQQQRQDISKAQILAQDYKKLCSLCRHSKFSDAEQLINQPDWAVPIDYQDDQGNALLHVAAQNGSKRLIKLCLRRGANLNLQNLNGQTALHFAYGYGYTEVGDYLVDKGADDSLRNKDNLTCYEGLGARELALL